MNVNNSQEHFTSNEYNLPRYYHSNFSLSHPPNPFTSLFYIESISRFLFNEIPILHLIEF